ncbi:hypothetical protein [Pseudomonas protegens]|uniref:hypothetical protein n=1 Tax=Pseudomonas protegens TaxID=380021 RepID=UPI000CD23931|nr:hypothetical protein [Pseudomonas protegens]POA88017.1 hypothetical protein C1883_16155 [Pseudomonas protegens]
MDAKNIQKLQKLKEEMEFLKKQKTFTARHIPGQGFSDESEKFFAGVSEKKRDDLARQFRQEASLEPSKEPSPDHEVDETTLELRREFARLNKIREYQEIAGSRKLSRKASRAAIKEAKKIASESNVDRPTKKTKQIKAPKKKSIGERIEKTCFNCKAKFHIYSNWARPPALCAVCTKYVNEAYLPSGCDRSVPTGWIHVVSGGAPGLGKR